MPEVNVDMVSLPQNNFRFFLRLPCVDCFSQGK